MLARAQRLLDDGRLLQDGQGDVDGADVGALQEVGQRLARGRGAVEVDGHGGRVFGGSRERLSGGLRAGIDRFERQVGGGFDGGEVF